MLIEADAISIFSINLLIFMAMNFSHFSYLNLKYKDKIPKSLISYTNTFVNFHCLFYIVFNTLIVNKEFSYLLILSYLLSFAFVVSYNYINKPEYVKYLLFAMLISVVLYNFSISTFYGVMHTICLLLMVVAANIYMFTTETLSK